MEFYNILSQNFKILLLKVFMIFYHVINFQIDSVSKIFQFDVSSFLCVVAMGHA